MIYRMVLNVKLNYCVDKNIKSNRFSFSEIRLYNKGVNVSL